MYLKQDTAEFESWMLNNAVKQCDLDHGNIKMCMKRDRWFWKLNAQQSSWEQDDQSYTSSS